MQKTQIVTHFLIPADQHPSEAVHPAMRAFHYPPPCLEPELVFQHFRFISPCPDMGGKAKLEQQPPYLLIVITFVEIHPWPRRWDRAARWRCSRWSHASA